MTQDDNALFAADLSNPDLLVDGKIALRRENIHMNRVKFIWNGACHERLSVRNFSDRPLRVRLTYRFASDFADLFEVRGEHRAARGVAHSALESDHGVALEYLGLDRIERDTRIEFFPAPKTLTTLARGIRTPHQAARHPAHIRALRCGRTHLRRRRLERAHFHRRMRAARRCAA